MSSSDPPAQLPDSEREAQATADEYFAAMYEELRALALRQLQRSAGAAVSATTLLHEAYLGMAGKSAVFPDQGRFMGYAARVMRGLIIDMLRERRALKRGAEFRITLLPTEVEDRGTDEQHLSKLSIALDDLAQHDPQLAELVDLKYFCGYTFEEIATLRGVSDRTVRRDWRKARMALFTFLKDAPEG